MRCKTSWSIDIWLTCIFQSMTERWPMSNLLTNGNFLFFQILEFDQKRNVRQVFLLFSSSIFCVDISDEWPKQSQSQLCTKKLSKQSRIKIFFVYKFSLIENKKHNWIKKKILIKEFIFFKNLFKVFFEPQKMWSVRFSPVEMTSSSQLFNFIQVRNFKMKRRWSLCSKFSFARVATATKDVTFRVTSSQIQDWNTWLIKSLDI